MGNDLDSHEFWTRIAAELQQHPTEIQTVTRNRQTPIWFLASIGNNVIVIENARDHVPSSKINSPRRITEDEFCVVFPHYFTWLDGTEQRHKIRDRYSQNTSYIFGLIHHFFNRR